MPISAGIFVNLYAVKMVYSGQSCYVGAGNIVLSLSMYTSYFVLFCLFFYNTYLNKPEDKSKVKYLVILTVFNVFCAFSYYPCWKVLKTFHGFLRVWLYLTSNQHWINVAQWVGPIFKLAECLFQCLNAHWSWRSFIVVNE